MKKPLVALSILLLPVFVLADQKPKSPRGGDVRMIILDDSNASSETIGGRQAWQWSLEERIAARCSPVAARERLRGGDSARTAMSASPASAAPVDVISGKTHPELFMPTELFEDVVRGAFLVDHWQDAYAAAVQKAGLPKDFANTLEGISASYLPLLTEKLQIAQRRNLMSAAERAVAIARLAELEPRICHERQAALHAARGRFGPALDRFLYESIARSRTTYLSELSDPTVLTAREKGCR